MGNISVELIGLGVTILAAFILPFALYVRRLSNEVLTSGFVKQDALTAAVKEVEDRVMSEVRRLPTVLPDLSDLRTRLDRLEEAVEHVPTKDELHSVSQQLALITGRLEILTGLQQQVHRIENHLLHEARR